MIRSFIRSRIRKLKGSMKTNIPCVFKDPEVTKCLKSLHDKYVIVPPNNFVCKDYYHQCLVNELGSTNTYLATALTKEEILQNAEPQVCHFFMWYRYK